MEGVLKEYEDITKVVISTYLFGIRFYRREIASIVSLDKDETWNFDYSVSIPGIAPSATYQVQMEVLNAESNVIKCWALDLKL